uniref:winged helix-turn-helix transcriptional regulator n=1 Tax=Staphylococcus saprophyticus TaxID=29385 RepID=UPI00119EA7D9
MPTSPLKRPIPTTTQNMLTQQLPQLQKHPIINPILYHQLPPKLQYQLSQYPQTLPKILSSLSYSPQFHLQKIYNQHQSLTLNQQHFLHIPPPS